MAAQVEATRLTGLIFDPTYTGKAIYGLREEIRGGSFGPDDVVRLAALAGLSLSDADAEALVEALAAHTEMVGPLFEARLEDEAIATTYDPRWRV